MEIGKLYKSIFDDVIVQCTSIRENDFFCGYVVSTGKSKDNYINEYCSSWCTKAFELYTSELPVQEPTTDQIGGSHYKNLKIQPTEFIHTNNIGFIEGNIIKYVVRHKDKNGIEDLKKARHYIDLLIKFEYEDPKKL